MSITSWSSCTRSTSASRRERCGPVGPEQVRWWAGEGKWRLARRLAVGHALHAIAQEPDDTAFEVDAFDAVELDLSPIMLGEDLLRDFLRPGLGRCAIAALADPLQCLLEHSGM